MMRAAQFAQRPAAHPRLFKDQRPQIQAGTGRERAAVILAFGGRNVEILDFAHLLPAGAQLGDRRGDLCDHLAARSEEHTSELQSQSNLVCRLLLEKKKKTSTTQANTTTHEPCRRDETRGTRASC